MRRAHVLARTSSVLLVGLAALAACGPPKRSAEPTHACAVTLPERPAGPLVAPPLRGAGYTPQQSTVIIRAEIPLALVARRLEAKVPRRVAEERDRDIGVAGRLEYTADRGPFRLAVRGASLEVATTVDIRARACAKGNCYAGCEPRAEVVARVPLRVGADYKFRAPAVSISLTRGCEVRALGGLATVDVTPTIASQLDALRPRLEQQIRAELPDLRPEAERMWKDLSVPRPLALGACMVVAPEHALQGIPSGNADHATLTFGLQARPELWTRCSGDPTRVVPLPPLRDDDALPPEGDVFLSLILPKEAPAASLEGAEIALGAAKGRIAHAEGTTPLGLALTIGGDACGTVALQASGATWLPDGRSVHLAGTTLLPGEPERLAVVHADPDAFLHSVERAPIPVPISPTDLGAMLPDLVRAESNATVDLSATISSAAPGDAGLRGPRGEVVAVMALKGAVTIRAK